VQKKENVRPGDQRREFHEKNRTGHRKGAKKQGGFGGAPVSRSCETQKRVSRSGTLQGNPRDTGKRVEVKKDHGVRKLETTESLRRTRRKNRDEPAKKKGWRGR